jgi:hypothetical protein
VRFKQVWFEKYNFRNINTFLRWLSQAVDSSKSPVYAAKKLFFV